MTLFEKINNRTARCAVIGLGYVGLPLLTEMARAGYEAVGIDVSREKVESINKGVSYIPDVASVEVAALVQPGKMRATTDYAALADVDIISICVPTPLRKTKEPDISYIVSACDEVARYLKKNQLIILESTTYPGTTEEIMLPILTRTFHKEAYEEVYTSTGTLQTTRLLSEEHTTEILNSRISPSEESTAADSRLEAGRDFFLAFSPERVDPGNEKYKTKDIPKVIGGLTTRCTEMAAAFYGTIFTQVVPVSSARSAEMVKLLENTFRSVNIALANEMALMSDVLEVDIWEVIEAAATKPFGFMPFYPGPGLGGHCIPIDPLYLTWRARLKGFEPKFIELASEVNQKMPQYIVYRIQDRLNQDGKSLRGSNVVIIGVAYKRGVSDTRESPSIEIIKLLKQKGAEVFYYDPYVPELKHNGIRMTSIELSEAAIKGADCVVIATDHPKVDYDIIREHAVAVVDTRNVLTKQVTKSHRMTNDKSQMTNESLNLK